MVTVPNPALVVLVGASASGKSTWAQARYRAQEIVASDDLRGVVGSGRHDLDATDDAFRLLDLIVAARARRGLTCVVDTLGLDAERRRTYLDIARAHRLPAVAVLFEVPAQLARERNRQRDRPVPAPALTSQLQRAAGVRAELEDEAWDLVLTVQGSAAPIAERPAAAPDATVVGRTGMDFYLQISRFPWGDDPAAWLASMAVAADEAGFRGIALMDHLIQIPQVGRAWEPIPEPWVTLGMLAGLDTDLRLGTLVSPVTYRPAGVLAKTVATLDALSGGRALLGIGAGWWRREHEAFAVPFPSGTQRWDELETAIETIRALWSAGTKAYESERVQLPETTCYPRPVGDVPIIVGGSGLRTLRIAARLADGCNLTTTEEETLAAKLTALREECGAAGRNPDELLITVLDHPVVGSDREEVWTRVEQLRGRTSASAYARTSHAGTYSEQRTRYGRLAELGVGAVFLAPPHVRGPEDVLALQPMLT